jgi:hypothetical protein
VNEMQTAAMEREYARAVSIWTIEAISQDCGARLSQGFIMFPPVSFYRF